MTDPNHFASRSSRKLLSLFLALVATACAGVLGIEERKLDSVDTYPTSGYQGCSPTTGCGDCLEMHRPECEARAACEAASGQEGCFSCVCGSCLESVVECRMDPGCNAVWQCLQNTRCHADQSGEGSCAVACASVLREHGGTGGGAFQAALAIRACAVSGGCLSCLAPETSPPPGCDATSGCNNCDGCVEQCVCSGDSPGDCQAVCAVDLPDACTASDGCAGCTTCVDGCVCEGGAAAECTTTCQAPSCTQAAGCDTCGGCVEQCTCEGGVESDCRVECEAATLDACTADAGGSGALSCGGCTSCLADCTCRGGDVDTCMAGCGMFDCCEAGDCSTNVVSCACDAGMAQCAAQSAFCDDRPPGCDQCACNRCQDAFVLCQGTPGCSGAFDCMARTGCEGTECAQCTPTAGDGASPDAFGAAEALWACTEGQGCGCDGRPPPGPVSCGGVSCPPYLGTEYVAQACCMDPSTSVPGIPSTFVPCGLDLRPFFPDATTPACTRLSQDYPTDPNGNETCPRLTISDAPYDGATLEGCCRADTGLCGLWDTVLGLGCTDAGIFGQAPQACP